MRYLVFGIGMMILSIFVNVNCEDTYYHDRQLDKLKFVSEQAAAAAAQYKIASDYGDGHLVFNRDEGIKAAAYFIKKDLNLDDNFDPIGNNYWTEKITYKIEFFDDSNTAYPYIYSHPISNLNQIITSPTVVVTIDAGKPRYRNIKDVPDAIRIAAHSWRGRGSTH